MSNLTYLFSLNYLNLFGIFCFLLHQDRLKVSRFWKLLSLFKILITFLLQAIVYHRIFVTKTIIASTIPHLRGFSNFTIFLLVITNFSMVFSSYLINFVALKSDKSIKMVSNSAIKIYKTLNQESRSKMHKNVRNLNCLAFILSLFYTILILTVLRMSIFSLILGCVLIPTPITFSCFLCLMKGSQIFLELLLQDINENFKNAIIDKDKNKYNALTRKYQNLYELSENINKVFGIQITTMTTALSVVATFNVRFFYIFHGV